MRQGRMKQGGWSEEEVRSKKKKKNKKGE